MRKTSYIATLPEPVRREIEAALKAAGIGGSELEDAMNSRLCDLEDTINTRRWTEC